jgi:hypothetical protein
LFRPLEEGDDMKKFSVATAIMFLTVTTAAWALPGTISAPQRGATDLVQVSSKGKGKGKSHYAKKNHHHHHHDHVQFRKASNGKYWYGNRYWTYRYVARPYNYQTLGCAPVGPFWYCP